MPTPGVFVQVESFKSQDIALREKRSLHVNSNDSKSESLAVGQDQARASQIDRCGSRRDSFMKGVPLITSVCKKD